MSFTRAKVFTGAVPFSDKTSRTVRLAIVGDENPSWSIHLALTDKLWTLVQRCWDQDAHRHPNGLRISRGLYVLVRNQVDLG